MSKKLTTEQFIEKAVSVHGTCYAYNNTKYSNNLTKVSITCLIHGDFEQTPSNHLRGAGCPMCGNKRKADTKRITQEQFLTQAMSVHGSSYEYSNSIYIDCKTPLTIKCRIHGNFLQSPNNHLQGRGCPQCARQSQRKTKEQFLKEAQFIHGAKYDYSFSNYTTIRANVTIVCPIHGLFEQKAARHLQGRGCQRCAKKTTAEKKRFTTPQFIEKAQSIHVQPDSRGGNIPKYKYDNVFYIDSKTPVLINCPFHGGFWQSPNTHLGGHGCLKCCNELMGLKRRLTKGEFIERAKAIHLRIDEQGNSTSTYNYDKVDYKKSDVKVLITCPAHGDFSQTPGSHLNGSGCPYCNPSGFKFDIPAILYFTKLEKDIASFWKIGVTTRTLKQRFRNDYSFVTEQYTWNFATGYAAYGIEQFILSSFADYKLDSTNITPLSNGGHTECFASHLPKKHVVRLIEEEYGKLQGN